MRTSKDYILARNGNQSSWVIFNHKKTTRNMLRVVLKKHKQVIYLIVGYPIALKLPALSATSIISIPLIHTSIPIGA